MMNLISRVLVVTGVCVMTSVVGGAPVAAQQSPSPAADKNAVVLIPGVMTGPGTMGPRGYRRLCTTALGRSLRTASALDRAGRAANRNPTRGLERSAIGIEQGDRGDVDGVQGGNAHDDEIRIGDDGQPARDHVSGRKDPAAGVRRVLRLAG